MMKKIRKQYSIEGKVMWNRDANSVAYSRKQTRYHDRRKEAGFGPL